MFTASAIKRHALDVGFDLVGVAPASAAEDLEFLPRWLEKEFGGEMRYLADPRREDPRRVLASVKSIICVGLIYNSPYPYSTEVAGPAEGKEVSDFGGGANSNAGASAWISRYAWGRDYHEVMRGKLEQLRTAVETLTAQVETRVYVDTGPIVERAFARLSGIGWMGKNTCLINERVGSWFFLGVILSNLELEPDLPAPDRCGSCTRCLEACPTGALVEPYVMDASRCISYLNIELRGAIPEEFRTAIGANVFGCDICQDVCPWNNRSFSVVSGQLRDEGANFEHTVSGAPLTPAATTKLPEFQPMEIEVTPRATAAECRDGGEPVSPASTQELSLFHPPIAKLAAITEEDFRRVFARSPIKRAKYRGWVRNLCVVMGNSGDRQFIPWLEAAAENSDPLVREHATWALRRLKASAS